METIEPKIIDGIKCYAPELIMNNDFYPAQDFSWLHDVEDINFWFRARAKFLKFLFKKYINSEVPVKFLEIGCGTGGILKIFSDFENVEIFGAEISLDYLNLIKKELPNIELMQLDATKMPFTEDFDSIGAFDVIEHIEKDALVLENIYKSLKKEGLIFISVPQHQWLWSQDDEKAYHKRRYSRGELIKKVKDANFEIIFCSSFVFTLLPFMAPSRLFKKNNKVNDSKAEFNLPPFINSVFYLLMMFDLFLVKIGFRLPFGGSLALVARKK